MLQLMPQGNMNYINLQDFEPRTIPYKLYNYQSKKNAWVPFKDKVPRS